MAFCWFPPDRVENGWRSEMALIENCAIVWRASAASWRAREPAAAPVLGDVGRRQVLGQAHADEGGLAAVLGDEGEAPVHGVVDRGEPHLLALQGDRAVLDGVRAEQHAQAASSGPNPRGRRCRAPRRDGARS